MANDKPVTDLKNIEKDEQSRAADMLLSELSLGEKSGEENGWLSVDAVEKNLGIE